MTFETNRNAGCEDCFSRIYCQKAKPRWKPAKMSAVARQGSFAFLRPQRQTWMFVFALSFFSVFSSLNITDLLCICLAFLGVYTSLLCQRPVVLKSLRCLAWNALCTFLPVISLGFDCMCERACAWERERGVETGQDDYNHYSRFYTFFKKTDVIESGSSSDSW